MTKIKQNPNSSSLSELTTEFNYRPTRILLVDDDEDTFHLTKIMLSELDNRRFELDWTYGFEKAKQRMLQGSYDVHLVDYRLGKQDGLALLRWAIKNGCQAPIILLTGHGDQQVDWEAMKAGAADYLVKGEFDSALLERSIRYAIQHHRTLMALHHSQAQNQAIVNAMPDLMFLLASNGTILEIKTGHFSRLLNLQPSKIKGQQLSDILPLAQTDFHHYLQQALTTNQIQVFEGQLLLPDGARDLEFRLIFSEDHEILALVRDITERKRAEQALQENQRQLATLLSNLPGMGYRCHNDYHFTTEFVSEGCLELTGYSPADLMGGQVHYGQLIHEADRERVWLSVQAAIQEGRPYRHIYRLITAQKHERWVSEQGRGVFSPDGELIALEGFIGDITELKLLESQLLQSQKMEAIGQLAGGIAHDFNNLLTAIVGYSQLLLSDTKLPESYQRDIEQIKTAGDRAATLTRQLLAFSRRQVMQPKLLDLNLVLEHLLNLLHRLLGERILLRFKPDPDLKLVKADPGQIEQVILNLAMNARDAMPRGGQLLIETADVQFQQPYVTDQITLMAGEYTLLSMTDTGEGMDAETEAHLFEPFFTTKEQGKGTGLGLATVYGIIKQSGGDIAVKTALNEGTSFQIYLPAVRQAKFSPQPELPIENLHGSETILLVEDEEAVRRLAFQALSRYGYRVLEAHNGEEAQTICKTHQGTIDAVVTDIIMPGLSGPQLAERLLPWYPELKVLYISGYTDDHVFHHGISAETGHAFLQKPFTPKILVGKLRQLLDRPSTV